MDTTHDAIHARGEGRSDLRATHPLRLIAVPAVITLAVTLLRLTGELNGWSPRLFGGQAGGGGALIGISWLIPVFGAWFGWRLARAGDGPASALRAILLPVAGIALMALTGFLVFRLVGTTSFFLTLGIMLPVAALLALLPRYAWPALWKTNLAYGIAARIPVVAVTVLAIAQGWDTHYVKLAPGAPPVSDATLAAILSTVQIVLWVPLTILLGGLTGGIAGALARRRR